MSKELMVESIKVIGALGGIMSILIIPIIAAYATDV